MAGADEAKPSKCHGDPAPDSRHPTIAIRGANVEEYGFFMRSDYTSVQFYEFVATIPAAPPANASPIIGNCSCGKIIFRKKKINELQNTRGQRLWQRNYYEYIIRNEQSHRRIADYIINHQQSSKLE